MKSINIKILLLAIATAILIINFTGCSDDPIFAAIESEVQLKDPSVQGHVLSLVSHDGDLYTANGYLYRRTGGTGEWNKIGLPSGAHRCSQVAVTANDGTGELFALFQNSSWGFHSVQRYTGSGWALVSSATNGSAIKNGNGFVYFFRIDSQDDNSSARTVRSVHRIAPSGTMTEVLPNLEFSNKTGERPIDADGDYFITNSAVYTSSGTKISTGTNAPDRALSGIAVNGTDVYTVTGTYVYHYNGSSWTQFLHDATSPAYGVTYFNDAGKRLLLIPCAQGYGEVVLNASGQPVSNQEPGQSDNSSIPTTSRAQYASTMSDWNIMSLFVVTNPVPAGNAYCLYAGILDTTDGGLWSYYSDTRKEWNRE